MHWGRTLVLSGKSRTGNMQTHFIDQKRTSTVSSRVLPPSSLLLSGALMLLGSFAALLSTISRAGVMPTTCCKSPQICQQQSGQQNTMPPSAPQGAFTSDETQHTRHTSHAQ
jgi:hypothetical protein